jgi:hypothetical protein
MMKIFWIQGKFQLVTSLKAPCDLDEIFKDVAGLKTLLASTCSNMLKHFLFDFDLLIPKAPLSGISGVQIV